MTFNDRKAATNIAITDEESRIFFYESKDFEDMKKKLLERLPILTIIPPLAYNVKEMTIVGGWSIIVYNDKIAIAESAELKLQYYGANPKFHHITNIPSYDSLFYIGGLNPEKNFLIAGRCKNDDNKIKLPVKIELSDIVRYETMKIFSDKE